MADTAVRSVWRDLLERWDAQQEVYIEGRERGFDVIFALLDVLVPGDVVAVDLAGGPGSIGRRLLERRAGARCLSVDADPVLQTVGEQALGDVDGRLSWVRADLRDRGWAAALGDGPVDAVLSSTALHWLATDELAALYRSLAGVLRPGGVLVDFDHFPEPHAPTPVDDAVAVLDRARQERALARGADGWQDWWDAARELPELATAFDERDRVFAPARGRVFAAGRRKGTSLAFHRAALLDAGFASADVVWQDLTKKILVAVR